MYKPSTTYQNESMVRIDVPDGVALYLTKTPNAPYLEETIGFAVRFQERGNQKDTLEYLAGLLEDIAKQLRQH